MTQGEKKKNPNLLHEPTSFFPCEGFAHLAGRPLTAHRSGSLTTPRPYQGESLYPLQRVQGLCFISDPQ